MHWSDNCSHYAMSRNGLIYLEIIILYLVVFHRRTPINFVGFDGPGMIQVLLTEIHSQLRKPYDLIVIFHSPSQASVSCTCKVEVMHF